MPVVKTCKNFRQSDKRWGGILYPTSPYMVAGSGCGPTACADIIASNPKYKNITPRDTAKWMVKHGYAVPGHGTEWAGIKACLKAYGFIVINHATMADFFAEMKKPNRRAVILFHAGTRGGVTWTGSGHFVGCAGMTVKHGKHYLYTLDPSNRKNDGWHAYETTMRGLIPQIWSCHLASDDKKQPKKDTNKKTDKTDKKENKTMHGIDISVHNGNIDLKPYKNQFVIIRGGYYNTVDSKAKRNMSLCEKLGIPYGIYWYSYALNVSQAKMEAQTCLKLIKGHNIKCGVWFDMEDADGYKKRHGMPSNATISAMCMAFCNAIKKAGYHAGIYASQSWFNTKITGCGVYDYWVANWGVNNGKQTTNTSKLGPIQQYTSKPIDKNIMYVPLSHFSTPNSSKKKTTPKTKKPTETIAREVIAGKWGDGDTRKKKLKAAGYDYNVIQKKVNELLKKPAKKSIDTIAREVIAGKWGNGDTRKKKLKAAGYDYSTVQKRVNQLVK